MLKKTEKFCKVFVNRTFFQWKSGEWLKHRARGQPGLGSKPTRAILLCPWERHFKVLLGCLVILASNKISTNSIFKN